MIILGLGLLLRAHLDLGLDPKPRDPFAPLRAEREGKAAQGEAGCGAGWVLSSAQKTEEKERGGAEYSKWVGIR